MSDIYIRYEQDIHGFLQDIYGFSEDVDGTNDVQVTQELGGVRCREGRLIAFPNKLQHQVSSFSLADRSKRGHRKILALFLVDPHRRIISSANVPPQREDWAPCKSNSANDTTPQATIFPEQRLMTMMEAKQHRIAIMTERGLKREDQNKAFEVSCFNLCEH